MNRLFTLLLITVVFIIGCTNAGQKTSNSSTEKIQEVQQIDSITTELEETNTEIKEKINALENALDDLDN